MSSLPDASEYRTPLGARILKMVTRPDLGPVIALLLITLTFGLADQFWGRGFFLTPGNFKLVIQNSATVAVPALGMTIIIIAGGIDLSAGCAIALCSVVLAYMLENDYGWKGAVVCTFLTGLLCGLVNGLIVVTTRIVPFIVTLGTMTIFVGVGSLITKELSLSPPNETIPHWLRDMSKMELSDLGFLKQPLVPLSPLVAIASASALMALLHFTVLGRWIFAVGSNERTARLAGIPVARVKLIVYSAAGLFVALGALYMFSQTKSASANSGIGLELNLIAAVVIGGGSLAGGRGSVIGTLAGATLAAVIESGCIQLGLGSPIQKIIIGLAVIAAVALDRMRSEPPDWLRSLIPRSDR